MPAKKGQRHRSFTYDERKINKMNRTQLLKHLFITKLDTDEVAFFFANDYEPNIYLTTAKIRRIMKGVEVIELREIKENEQMNLAIDAVFDFKKDMDGIDDFTFSNSEGLAVLAYVAKKFQGRQRQPKKEIRERAYFEALDLWRAGGDDWDKLMSSLS